MRYKEDGVMPAPNLFRRDVDSEQFMINRLLRSSETNPNYLINNVVAVVADGVVVVVVVASCCGYCCC